MFFKSIPTSRVTPSPNRRLDAATCVRNLPEPQHVNKVLTYFESIFLVNPFDWRRESSELIGDRMNVVGSMRSVTRTIGMLRGIDEPQNGRARRCHGCERGNYVDLG